jgi:hypothetical protein
MPEERAVTAIVLDHEQTDKKTCGRNGQQQIKAVTEVEREPHQYPKHNKGHDGDQDFDDAAPIIGFPIARQSLNQFADVNWGCAAVGAMAIHPLKFTAVSGVLNFDCVSIDNGH